MGFYGWLELDALWDSTQSFNETVLNQNISRPGTYAGDNPRFQATVKDSRIGFKVAAPNYGSIKASAQFEADFFGMQPTTVTQDQQYTYSSIRLRHYFAKLETPVFDLLAGQTFDLYGWGGQGFFPSTPAFLGVMGEVFHRNVQLRLSKTISGDHVALEIAVAGVRPATRDWRRARSAGGPQALDQGLAGRVGAGAAAGQGRAARDRRLRAWAGASTSPTSRPSSPTRRRSGAGAPPSTRSSQSSP